MNLSKNCSIPQTLVDAILTKAYTAYKKKWNNERGYDITDIDEEIGINGECHVCFAEFEMNEFQDEEYIKNLLDTDDFKNHKLILKDKNT